MGMWSRYVSVSERKSNAHAEMNALRKKGKKIEPVNIEGRQISKKFWGQMWCDHLDAFADYDNRLPRGRTYVRNGSVCHLSIEKGCCEAFVSGSELYKVVINIAPLAKKTWEEIISVCKGKIGSLLELLQGKLSHEVMKVVSNPQAGLFPKEEEFTCKCSCPDWATICKHIAAVFYGIGNRLDDQPHLLFQLRSVDPSELIDAQIAVDIAPTESKLANDDLSALFGIEMDTTNESPKNIHENKSNKKKTKVSPKPQEKKLSVDKLTGKLLKKFREQKEMTVNEFAEMLGVTSATIYRWEKATDLIKTNSESKKALSKILTKGH